MAETGYYILCTAIFLVILWIFLFKIETGVLLFFAAGLSIQYLEKFVFGSFSALDVAGMVFPFLFFFGLWIGKKNIIYECLSCGKVFDHYRSFLAYFFCYSFLASF